RRRHTRFSRDWSSDVCSSDLGGKEGFKHFLFDMVRHSYSIVLYLNANLFTHKGCADDDFGIFNSMTWVQQSMDGIIDHIHENLVDFSGQTFYQGQLPILLGHLYLPLHRAVKQDQRAVQSIMKIHLLYILLIHPGKQP